MGATFAILDCRPAVRIDECGSHRGQEPQEGASHVHRLTNSSQARHPSLIVVTVEVVCAYIHYLAARAMR